MPPLMFGSKGLSIAADDLALPSLVGMFTRVAGLAISFGLMVTVLALKAPTGCDTKFKEASPFFIAMFLVQGCLMFVYFSILVCATRGAIPEYEKRESMELLVILLSIVYLFEFGVAIFGIPVAISHLITLIMVGILMVRVF